MEKMETTNELTKEVIEAIEDKSKIIHDLLTLRSRVIQVRMLVDEGNTKQAHRNLTYWIRDLDVKIKKGDKE